MLLFDNMAVNMNGENHCQTWYCTKQFWKFWTTLHTGNFHERGWEMSKTQRKWITPAAAPMQRSYGVVAVSQKYQNFQNWRRYVIAASFWLCKIQEHNVRNICFFLLCSLIMQGNGHVKLHTFVFNLDFKKSY